MAIIVETGTGAADSESYSSVADADAFLAGVGDAAWDALTDAAKEQALRRATRYMGQTYRGRWLGFRVTDVQALDWPRNFVPRADLATNGGALYWPADAVPRSVRDACIELARRAAAVDLLADLDPAVAEEEVGPVRVKYATGTSRSKSFPAVERLLGALLSGASSVRIVRA